MTNTVSSVVPVDVRVWRPGPGDAGLHDAMLDLVGEAYKDPGHYSAARPDPARRSRLLASDTFVALVACQDEMLAR